MQFSFCGIQNIAFLVWPHAARRRCRECRAGLSSFSSLSFFSSLFLFPLFRLLIYKVYVHDAAKGVVKAKCLLLFGCPLPGRST